MDYKKTNAPHNTITRDMNQLSEEVGNIYETVAILGKRANQIGIALKKELDAKLQDFSIPQEGIDEVFENKEQIEISKSYERFCPSNCNFSRRCHHVIDYYMQFAVEQISSFGLLVTNLFEMSRNILDVSIFLSMNKR